MGLLKEKYKVGEGMMISALYYLLQHNRMKMNLSRLFICICSLLLTSVKALPSRINNDAKARRPPVARFPAGLQAVKSWCPKRRYYL